MTQTTTGGYVRHRDRMIQESVFEDLRDTLIACRWLGGTTVRPVWDPYNPTQPAAPLTTDYNNTFKLLERDPIELIDYFPETEDIERGFIGNTFASKTAPNTFALDNGTMGDAVQRELGSNAQHVPYTFNMAFFATSDAVAQAVFNDLRDRYAGRIVRDDSIALWDYNAGGELPVVQMDVEKFSYRLNTELATPTNIHLYFGELLVLDEVD